MPRLVQCRHRLLVENTRKIIRSSSSTYNSNSNRSVSSASAAAAAAKEEESIDSFQTQTQTQKKKKSLLWRFLKYGGTATLVGTAAATGYITYAYSVDQLDEMTKPFRDSATKYTPPDADASSLQKFEASVYSAVMSAPAKCIEMYLDMRRSMEEQIRGFTEPISDKLLPDMAPNDPRITLVVDLNETLIYTDWKRERGWRTFKRPGVDMFLDRLGPIYEIVVYSDQLDMYVNPILERLDPKGYVQHKLYRPATKYQDGKHYRDLSKLNRDGSRIIYVSGHALETALQPDNCAPIKPWKLEDGDTALVDLIPFLEFVARQHYSRPDPPDIRQVLASYKDRDIATEFNKRQREAQEKHKLARRFL